VIQAHPEPLPVEKQAALRTWLAKPECALLKTIAESEAKRLQAQAVNEAVAARKNDGLMAVSEGSMQESLRYEHFVQVLTELIEMDKHTTTRLK
jgi:hypothetical protein